MSIAMELAVARKNTRAFIAADPREVQLRRPVYVDDGAGGRVPGPDLLLPPQSIRLVPLSGLVWDRSDTTPDEGQLADVTMQLVGYHDADLKKDDWFLWQEDDLPGRYVLTHVSPFRHYRSSAMLRFYEDSEIYGGG